MSNSVGRPTLSDREKKVSLHVSVAMKQKDFVQTAVWNSDLTSSSEVVRDALTVYARLFEYALNKGVTPAMMLERLITVNNQYIYDLQFKLKELQSPENNKLEDI